MLHEVRVGPLPDWLDFERLLGPGFAVEPEAPGWVRAHGRLDPLAAADLAARLRGVGLAGRPLATEVRPGLERRRVRSARTRDARARRETSAGFERPGARLDAQARMSLTPEALAVALGQRAAGLSVVDACVGAGGNAIGFARAGCRVIGVDRDPDRLRMARHNARLYGVAERIELRCGDAAEQVAQLAGDLLFVDPPWGEDWDRNRVGPEALEPLSAVLAVAGHFDRTWVKAPPSFDVTTLAAARPEAIFGAAPGDARRVKFLLLEL